jgi:hypothetical protein
MSGKNILLALIALVLTVSAVGVVAYYFSLPDPETVKAERMAQEEKAKQQIEQEKQDKIAAEAEKVKPKEPALGTSKLTFGSSAVTVRNRAVANIPVNVTPGTGEQVRAIQLVVKYDPKLIRVDDFLQNSFFDIYVGKLIDGTTGTATISASTAGQKLVTANTEVAKLKITRLAAGATTISIVKKDTGVTSYSSYTNAGGDEFSTEGSTITIN